jgi:hypothetical protein
MQKLSRTQIAARDEICRTLAERYEELEEAVFAFNEMLVKYWDAVEVAQDAYNASIADANEWRGEIAGEIEAYMDERSEKWRASDRGQAYSAWYDAFASELEAVELTMPDGVELEEGDQGEALAELPEEVDLS